MLKKIKDEKKTVNKWDNPPGTGRFLRFFSCVVTNRSGADRRISSVYDNIGRFPTVHRTMVHPLGLGILTITLIRIISARGTKCYTNIWEMTLISMRVTQYKPHKRISLPPSKWASFFQFIFVHSNVLIKRRANTHSQDVAHGIALPKRNVKTTLLFRLFSFRWSFLHLFAIVLLVSYIFSRVIQDKNFCKFTCWYNY